MFRQIATSALFAGFCTGLIAALLQWVFVQPVLLQAELYEAGALVHSGTETAASRPALPGFDPVRDGLSVLLTALIYTGYALILVALMAHAAQRGAVIDARRGMLWGVAGFVAVQLAPAFGLPPEVPGAAAADLADRQLWWGATVIASATAIWLIAFGRDRIAWGAAAVLLLAPHLVGAPQPGAFTGPVPPELAALFAARALGTGLAAWVVLGACAGHFWRREAAAAAPLTA